jgi:anti-sigma B factor antagonist
MDLLCEMVCLIMTLLVTPEIRKRGDVTIISFGPQFESLDEYTLDQVRDFVLESARKAAPPKVVIDLSHTKFFGSSFIEVLFRVWNRVNPQPGGKFGLCGLTPYCREVLEITHLDRLWSLYPNEDSAVADIA